jgi:hypothetical protein
MKNVVFCDVAPCSEERRFTQDLHSATSQKTAFFQQLKLLSVIRYFSVFSEVPALKFIVITFNNNNYYYYYYYY